jgi:hypothetical protein
MFYEIEISFEPSGLCPQSLMARMLERTGVLPSLADAEGGVGGNA